MKRFLTLLSFAACALQASAQDPAGTVVYCLPSTTLCFDVTAVQENFFAGPYAKYAAKYLGIEVREADQTTCQITKVKMTPYLEADQSRRFTVSNPGAGMFELSSQGLIAFTDGRTGDSGVWRFPSPSKGDFSDKGVNSNLLTQETTLYRNSKDPASQGKIAVQQNMVVEKSPEKRAAETAEQIFELRKKRLQIVTGDTDATYSGEAMGAAIRELTRLEKEYLSLFIGYSESRNIQARFELVPQAGAEGQKYVAFRISDTGGLVAADDLTGTPVILELTPEEIAAVPDSGKPAKGTFLTCRIPAVCKVRLYKGGEVLMQSRVPVYQLGIESQYPVQK